MCHFFLVSFPMIVYHYECWDLILYNPSRSTELCYDIAPYECECFIGICRLLLVLLLTYADDLSCLNWINVCCFYWLPISQTCLACFYEMFYIFLCVWKVFYESRCNSIRPCRLSKIVLNHLVLVKAMCMASLSWPVVFYFCSVGDNCLHLWTWYALSDAHCSEHQ